jgi:hypothetical protein
METCRDMRIFIRISGKLMVFFLASFFIANSGSVSALPLAEASFTLDEFSVSVGQREVDFIDEWNVSIETVVASPEGVVRDQDFKVGGYGSASSQNSYASGIGVAAIGVEAFQSPFSAYSMVDARQTPAVGEKVEASSWVGGINALAGPATESVDAIFSFNFSAYLKNLISEEGIETASRLRVEFWYFDPLQNTRVSLLNLDRALDGGAPFSELSLSERFSRSVTLFPDSFYPIFFKVNSEFFMENQPSHGSEAPVPEPEGLFLMVFGSIGLWVFIRKYEDRGTSNP